MVLLLWLVLLRLLLAWLLLPAQQTVSSVSNSTGQVMIELILPPPCVAERLRFRLTCWVVCSAALREQGQHELEQEQLALLYHEHASGSVLMTTSWLQYVDLFGISDQKQKLSERAVSRESSTANSHKDVCKNQLSGHNFWLRCQLLQLSSCGGGAAAPQGTL